MRTGWLTFALVVGLGIAAGHVAASDGPPRKSRITTFTISPAESLAPHPRPRVDTTPLDTPPGPPSMVVAASPLAPEQVLGRWTERDPGYCDNQEYVVEWRPDRLRLMIDGREIDGGRVRYTADGMTLKIEHLNDAGTVDAYWRLEGVDDGHVEWVETAELRDGVLAVIAKPEKLFLRCGPGPEHPPGMMAGMMDRVRGWWTAFVGRLWPASPPARSAGAAHPTS
jgi:hypothetical protein